MLIRDDPGWSYRGASGVSVRRLRVWWTGLGQVVAVITEQRDRRDQPAGTSITNAAEVIAARLAAQYAGEDIVQIEHYGEIAPEVKAAWRSQPPVTVTDIGEDGVTSYRFGGENTDPPLAAESYDRVTIEPGRAPRWERAHPGLLVWLGLRSR